MMNKNKIIGAGLAILIIIAGAFNFYFFRNTLAKAEDVVIVGVKGGATAFLLDVIKGEGIDQKNKVNFILNIAPSPPESDRRFYAREGVDVVNSGPTTVVLNNEKGSEPRIFGPFLLSHSSIVVRKDSPYFSVEDLKGRKVGTRPARTALHENFVIAMKIKGIDAASYFNLVFPQSIQDSIDLITKGDLDAVVIGEPNTSQLLADGKFREIAALKDIWREITGEPLGFIYAVAHKDWLDSHQTAAKRTVKTMLDAGKYINAHPEVFDKYKESLGWKTAEELAMLKKRMPSLYLQTWGKEEMDNAKLLLKTAKDSGVLQKELSADVFYEL